MSKIDGLLQEIVEERQSVRPDGVTIAEYAAYKNISRKHAGTMLRHAVESGKMRVVKYNHCGTIKNFYQIKPEGESNADRTAGNG